jgi:hypothetical protein
MTGLILVDEFVVILWFTGAVLRATADGPETAKEKDVVGAGDRLG